MVQAAQMTFAPEPENLKQLRNGLLNHVDHIEKLNPRNELNYVPNQDIGGYFDCKICHNIVEDPKECLNCSTLYCQSCIATNRRIDERCPICRDRFRLGARVNKIAMQDLNAKQFKCENQCGRTYAYKDRQEHLSTCGVFFTCNFPGCYEFQARKDSLEQLEAHWVNDCTGIELVCSECQDKVNRPEVSTHKCEDPLKKKLKQLEQKAGELQEENEQLKSRTEKAVEPQDQPQLQDNSRERISDKKCRSGHPMKYLTEARPRNNDPSINLSCDHCRVGFTVSSGYFKCESQAATCVDWDICRTCGLAKLPFGPLGKDAKLFEDVLVCGKRGHQMHYFAPGMLKKRGTNNKATMQELSTITCGACHKESAVSDVGGYYSCAGECCYEVCVNCARCPKSHVLVVTYGNPYTKEAEVPRCDKCQRLVKNTTMLTGYARCPTCKYDVCGDCYRIKH